MSTRDKGQDHENQLVELREFVSRRSADGWLLGPEYIDTASGGRADRPAFRRMFADAAARKFDLVLFWSLDRFSREGVLETLQHLQRLSASGVEWWSYREEYLRSVGVFRDAVLAILAAIAKQERIRISERVHAGLARARAKGVRLGRSTLVVDSAKILSLRAEGLSLEGIARRLGVARMTVYRRLKSAPIPTAGVEAAV